MSSAVAFFKVDEWEGSFGVGYVVSKKLYVLPQFLRLRVLSDGEYILISWPLEAHFGPSGSWVFVFV